jgi:hypothetical protein
MLAICLSSGLLLSSNFPNSVVHAAPSPLITKQTRVVSLSASACSALLKSESRLTKKDCTVTLTSTTVRSSSFKVANGCPSGYVSNSKAVSGDTTWDAELDTEFYFPGNCTRPSVTYINCQHNMDGIWPAGIVNNSCQSSNIDSNRVIAEGLWYVSLFSIAGVNLGGFSVTIQSIANSNGAITDTESY